MNSETPIDDETAPATPSPWLIGAVSGVVLSLLINLLLLVLVIDARREAAAAAAQARKAVRLMQEVKLSLKEAEEEKSATPPRPKAPAAPPQPQHIDAADPARDCVIRPGSGKGLSECLP